MARYDDDEKPNQLLSRAGGQRMKLTARQAKWAFALFGVALVIASIATLMK